MSNPKYFSLKGCFKLGYFVYFVAFWKIWVNFESIKRYFLSCKFKETAENIVFGSNKVVLKLLILKFLLLDVLYLQRPSILRNLHHLAFLCFHQMRIQGIIVKHQYLLKIKNQTDLINYPKFGMPIHTRRFYNDTTGKELFLGS